MSSAYGRGVLVENTILYPRSYGYRITPGTTDPSPELIDPAIASAIDDVVRDFGGHPGSELELRSTIHFVVRDLTDSGQVYDAAEVARRVRAIKPHFSPATAGGRIEAMRERGDLESAAVPD